MIIRAVITLLVAFTSVSTVANPPEQKVILGVLEDVPGKYVGQPGSRHVRVVFEKIGDGWRPFRSDCSSQDCLKTIASEYPAEVVWNTVFNGKNLGRVTSRAPKAFEFYSDIGLENITSTGPIPTVGKKSTEYGGFGESPVYRPLIANSQPYFRDPEAWKPAHLSAARISALHQQFRNKFPKVNNCANPEENIPKPWPYREQDIEITKSYSSNNNWLIAQVNLKPEENRCDGPYENPFIGQWFVISPESYIAFLAQGMWLVDVGDYDNDGKSEVVFAIDRYNRGGYELFYNNFKNHVTFEFGYH